jgi:hypothetical protein
MAQVSRDSNPCCKYRLSNLCFDSSLLILKRRLLEVVGGVISAILLLVGFSIDGSVTVDGLVLLGGLAGSVGGTIGALILLSLKTLDLLLGLGDVLQDMLAAFRGVVI